MKSPRARNGIVKPTVYTATSISPVAVEFELDTIINTVESAGPTQGVHAKLNTKPITSAVMGFILVILMFSGSWNCLPLNGLDRMSSWTSPSRITNIPPIRAKSIWLLLKNCPKAVNPSPSKKNAKLTPIIKNTVWTNAFFWLKFLLPSGLVVRLPPDRYPIYSGIIGKIQGEKKLSIPCRNTVIAGMVTSSSKPMLKILSGTAVYFVMILH